MVMKKSTDRIEKLLTHTQTARAIVREEQIDGHDCGTFAHDLERGEHMLLQRLEDLKTHNELCAPKASAEIAVKASKTK